MIISVAAVLAGLVLTGSQIVLIYLQGSGICLNEGCEIVDSMTTVDPLYFNGAGLLFFLVLGFALNRARKGSGPAKQVAALLLTGALAAEGVLFSFQLFVTQVFCSYCLIILGLIVIAALFMGLSQFIRGAFVFFAVFAAFASLDFHTSTGDGAALEAGTLARYEAPRPQGEMYLFFSSSCPYCETIIDILQTGSTCSINFNPINPIEAFAFPGAVASPTYSPAVNRSVLKGLGIDEIPALLIQEQEKTTVLSGMQAIRTYIEQTCRPAGPGDFSGSSEQLKSSEVPIPGLDGQDDGCTVSEACESESSAPGSGR